MVVVPTAPVGRMMAAAMLLLATACDHAPPRENDGRAATSSSPSSSAASATPGPAPTCSNPRIRFGPLSSQDVLLAVAKAVTITSRTGGTVDAPLRPVRRYTADVIAQGDAPRELVYDAFTRKLGDQVAPMPPLGAVASSDDDGAARVTVPGRKVQLEGVATVEATFTYECGATVIHGVVSSWSIPISGFFDCDRPRPKKRMYDEAAALACTD